METTKFLAKLNNVMDVKILVVFYIVRHRDTHFLDQL